MSGSEAEIIEIMKEMEEKDNLWIPEEKVIESSKAILEEFRKIISGHVLPLDKETNAKLSLSGRRIIDSLLSHASKEDDKLLPIVKKNRKIFKTS